MKIGILSREYPPLTHVGGIATYSAAAAELLVREGHEVHVICNGPEHKVQSQRGVTVHRIPMLAHHFPAGRLFYPYRAWYRRTLPHYLDALTWARTAAEYLSTRLHADGFDAWEYPETSGEGAFFPIGKPGGRGPRLVCRVHSSWMDDYSDNFLERRLLLNLQRKRGAQEPDHQDREHDVDDVRRRRGSWSLRANHRGRRSALRRCRAPARG